MDPGFSFLEPRAEISERLRRIFKLNQYELRVTFNETGNQAT